jgi:coenzyme F420-reducing hydrogenase delta subunit
MPDPKQQDANIVACVCANCMPQGACLPRQWEQGGFRVRVHEVPCSGKIETQYLFHAFEGGADGVCVVACPRGECHLAQGNYRAEIRVQTVRRLLAEIGMESDRILLVHGSPNDPPDHVEHLVREAVDRIATLGKASARAKA